LKSKIFLNFSSCFICTVPGPPASLKLFNATDTSVQAVWSPPVALNDVFTDYIVVANSINTYYTTNQLEPRQWMFPNSTLKAGLPDLHPGTQYNISVATHFHRVTGVKISDTIWTQIGGKHGKFMSTYMSAQYNINKILSRS
jgi:hypothetical protein